MTPARLLQVREIFEAALAREPAGRGTFVRSACSDDEPLRDEVLRLLRAKEEAGSFLEQPVITGLAAPSSRNPVFTTGAAIAHRFQILEILGSGGMGEVYRAHDRKLRRTVALKVLASEHLSDPERRRLLLKEARAASALNHPNIATVHDLSSEGEVDFITMEYVDGQTLDKLIPSGGLAVESAVTFAIQIADALAAAHSHGVVHRDLKPGNVMITAERSIKVLDFGLAKLTAPAPEDRPSGDSNPTLAFTPSGSSGWTQSAGRRVVGTAAYMSPEQAEGKPVDRRSDIFSFVCVLFEMLAGRRPFQPTGRPARDDHGDPP
jgi:serine/threonine-protein kinase